MVKRAAIGQLVWIIPFQVAKSKMDTESVPLQLGFAVTLNTELLNFILLQLIPDSIPFGQPLPIIGL
jgi:hypothetical protein